MPKKVYEFGMRAWVDRTVYIEADEEADIEELAKKEMVNLVGGFDPEVLWYKHFGYEDDWPMDRADD